MAPATDVFLLRGGDRVDDQPGLTSIPMMAAMMFPSAVPAIALTRRSDEY